MEQKHRNILQTSSMFLAKNIYNVEAVCDYLEMDEILTSGMVDEIKVKTPAPYAQIHQMLHILPTRGQRAYESFVAALIETGYKHSSDFLRAKEDPTSSQNSDHIARNEGSKYKMNTYVEDKHRNILQTCNVYLVNSIANVDEICDHLIQDGILDFNMVDEIMIKTSIRAKTRQMLRVLTTGGQRAYESFISALHQTCNEDCIQILREKEHLTSSQNSVQPKPKDVSGDDPRDLHDSTKSHCEKGENSKKSEGPPQNIQDEAFYGSKYKMNTSMEKKHRNILQTSNVFLTKNIYNVGAICDHLVDEGILDFGLVDKIMVKTPAPYAQIQQMLCILPTQGPRVYESFVAALIKTENNHCSDLLRAKENPTSSQNSDHIARNERSKYIQDTGMEEKHRKILQASHVFLVNNIAIDEVCDHLYSNSILDNEMLEEIMIKPTPRGKIRQMLSILPTRGQWAYESFLKALNETNNDCAELLRKKEHLTSSQNSVQPKPKDVSGDDPRDVHESTKSHCEKGENSKKSEGPPQNIQDEGWPDLQNGVQIVKGNTIQFISREDLTRISKNHKTYHMTGKNKGKVIIISNVPEQWKTDRCKPGRTRTSSHDMDFDKTSIQQLFKLMKFELKAKAGLQCQTGEELKESIKEIGEDTESSYDSLVVVILSGGIGYEPGQIYDKDGVMIPRDDVLQIIRDSPAFKGKPKIVIIKTYSFEEMTESYDTLDASKSILNIGIKPNNDDMFVVSSSPMTKMGPWMIGDNVSGSYFIQAFIHIFKNHAHEKSFLHLIEEVNKLLHTAMVPELIEGKYSDKCTNTHVAEAVVLEYSMEKELFLFPGLCDIPMKVTDKPEVQDNEEIKRKKRRVMVNNRVEDPGQQ